MVDSGQPRTLQASEYATRVAECRVAEAEVGPLGRYRPGDLAALLGALDDPVLRRRARHVVTECSRVRDTADALVAGDLAGAGALLSESHRSLAHDFAVTTPALDGLVAALSSTPGGVRGPDDRRRLRGVRGGPDPAGGGRHGGVAHAGLGRPGRRRDGGGEGVIR